MDAKKTPPCHAFSKRVANLVNAGGYFGPCTCPFVPAHFHCLARDRRQRAACGGMPFALAASVGLATVPVHRPDRLASMDRSHGVRAVAARCRHAFVSCAYGGVGNARSIAFQSHSSSG